jgi:hypothetical protein
MTHDEKSTQNREYKKPSFTSHIVVKFHDHVELPHEHGNGHLIDKLGHGQWSDLEESHGDLTLSPLFTSVSADKMLEMGKKAEETDFSYKAPSFHNYFSIDVPSGVDANNMVEDVTEWIGVHHSYPASTIAASPPGPIQDSQTYLDPAPDGIDAKFGWTVGGGNGDGVTFVDIEQGWDLANDDLPSGIVPIIGNNDSNKADHGTAVLGIVAGLGEHGADTDDIRGIARNVTTKVAGQYQGSGPSVNKLEDAIAASIETLYDQGLPNYGFGDVILIEAQKDGPVDPELGIPVELDTAVFSAIRLATALGITVIEPAGNADVDLDTYPALNRSVPATFKDSGAVLVGSATWLDGVGWYKSAVGGAYGSRVDCFAATSDVVSIGTTSFGGTSAASAIIAGAACAIQGIAIAGDSEWYRLTPQQIRTMLADPLTGTPTTNGASDMIGSMPDLLKILNSSNPNGIAALPDVYVRNNPDDTGSVNNGSVNSTPDVFNRQAQPSGVGTDTPEDLWGQNSGTEKSLGLMQTVEGTHDNYVYVRLANRRGPAATNVTATAFYGKGSTLVIGDDWNQIGQPVVIPSVPQGDDLIVSPVIVWPQAELPADGHYCMVVVIGNDLDPAPNRADFGDWLTFIKFVRVNNNVAWRNFNVVNNAGPTAVESTSASATQVIEDVNPLETLNLPFDIGGAPDMLRKFDLEVVARLPEGSRVVFNVPTPLLKNAAGPLPRFRPSSEKGISQIHVSAKQPLIVKHLRIPARRQFPASLDVYTPPVSRFGTYEVYISQKFKGVEVGRMTFEIVPAIGKGSAKTRRAQRE